MMLKVENLSCGYDDVTIIKNVSFSVKPNEKLCIMGLNGCGKTTLLRAVSGMLRYSGNILVDGKDMRQSKRKDIARKIAFMSQLSDVHFSYTVYETVMMGRYTHTKRSIFSYETQEDCDIVDNSLKVTGISELKDRPITELSGGQLQRVFLARTFAQAPEIILLDEPTNHLDLKYQLEIMDYLSQWAAEENHCVIGVLHDINLALSFADSLLLLDGGEIVAHNNIDKFNLSLVSQVYDVDIQAYMQTTLQRWAYADR